MHSLYCSCSCSWPLPDQQLENHIQSLRNQTLIGLCSKLWLLLSGAPAVCDWSQAAARTAARHTAVPGTLPHLLELPGLAVSCCCPAGHQVWLFAITHPAC